MVGASSATPFLFSRSDLHGSFIASNTTQLTQPPAELSLPSPPASLSSDHHHTTTAAAATATTAIFTPANHNLDIIGRENARVSVGQRAVQPLGPLSVALDGADRDDAPGCKRELVGILPRIRIQSPPSLGRRRFFKHAGSGRSAAAVAVGWHQLDVVRREDARTSVWMRTVQPVFVGGLGVLLGRRDRDQVAGREGQFVVVLRSVVEQGARRLRCSRSRSAPRCPG